MVREGYQRAGLDARVEPFLYQMDREMNDADLVISRAGATTLAEITASGKPSILIPLPTATDDHQRKNAEVLARVGAAEVIDQRELSGNRLAVRVMAMAADPAGRAAMAQAARALAQARRRAGHRRARGRVDGSVAACLDPPGARTSLEWAAAG